MTTIQRQFKIPPNPQVYRECLYRSTTEARYAVAFDRMYESGLDTVFVYEPEWFTTDHGGYRPDFLLAGQSLFAEVKPSLDADPDGVNKLRGLIRDRGKERGAILTSIEPGEMTFLLIGPDRGELWETDRAGWYVCPGGYHADIQPYPAIGCSKCPLTDGYWYYDERIEQAFAFARAYRFTRR